MRRQLTRAGACSTPMIAVYDVHEIARRLSPDEYLKTVCSSKMVVCASGQAPDAYRLWEALHCGAIPVVFGASFPLRGPRGALQLAEASTKGAGFFSANFGCIFPLLEVNSPTELAREKLLSRYYALRSSTRYAMLPITLNDTFWLTSMLKHSAPCSLFQELVANRTQHALH